MPSIEIKIFSSLNFESESTEKITFSRFDLFFCFCFLFFFCLGSKRFYTALCAYVFHIKRYRRRMTYFQFFFVSVYFVFFERRNEGWRQIHWMLMLMYSEIGSLHSTRQQMRYASGSPIPSFIPELIKWCVYDEHLWTRNDVRKPKVSELEGDAKTYRNWKCMFKDAQWALFKDLLCSFVPFIIMGNERWAWTSVNPEMICHVKCKWIDCIVLSCLVSSCPL